ncbi:YsnF/AvaK domain-containing protein [Massilia sp. Dwa41.01b]|uniref:YsnF/AvaK domain-containing protein n=1 Tax=unclassified Massilia TaxID=2609279 RepID=UPI00160009E2|nr:MULTISPECIES: YsnF/AvaK domain-containing protein [unclassified Massilia]QNA89083.1 YsnF/AvaK domain-containing protein [Massilia sp. Dwa41.01b]QNA99972.1 YsnF/AvaK domain-containing protein [Massilia sp. Se16.2.3]
MQHTLIAVFDNHNDATNAQNELLSSGFSSADVRLSHGNESTNAPSLTGSGTDSSLGSSTDAAGTEPGIGASIKNFFSDIFGTDNSEHSTKYSTAVERGNHVLTVNTDSEPEVERAADIVERYGPIDIDEQSEKWASGAGMGTGMSSGAMMGGAGSSMGGQSMSLQSDTDRLPLNQQSLNDPNPMGTTYQEPLGSRDELSVGSYGSGSGNLQQNTTGTSAGMGGRTEAASSLSSSSLTGSSLEGSASSSGSLQGSSTLGSQQRDTATMRDTAAIPVVEEQLKVGKREVQRGGVRIYSRIVETPVNESIGLREEHVNVERRPVNEPISGLDATAFKEQSIEMRETAEEAVVQKSARVVEEVTINKEVTQREQQIHDTVRHTEVEVEQLGGAQSSMMGDDEYYRNHFTSTYGSTGGKYDDYAPAYSYGTQMRQSELYRNRPWDDVEPELRSSWESRNAGSTGSTGGVGGTWDSMKAAVRHGWDKMTK